MELLHTEVDLQLALLSVDQISQWYRYMNVCNTREEKRRDAATRPITCAKERGCFSEIFLEGYSSDVPLTDDPAWLIKLSGSPS